MTLEQIQNLEIEDVSEILGIRLLEKDLPVTSENLNTEFIIYRQELFDVETERLRVQELLDRWKELKEENGGMSSFYAFKPNIPNAEKYIIELINDPERDDEATSFLSSLENENLGTLIEASKLKLYNQMVIDVYDEMETVFETRNDVSANAFATTWEAMSNRPANYVDTELGFTDEATVSAYANAKITQADAYAVKRLKLINKFRQDVLGL